MYILKNSLISIFRNKGRNILIGLIILTIACASTVTLAIRNTADTIVKSYEESHDLIATISFDRGQLGKSFKGGEDAQKENIEAFTAEVKEKGLNEYYTVNTNLEEITSATESIENVKTFATTFLIITLIISSLVLFVINMINIRERKYEIGVFRTIGMSKLKLTMQFVLELLIISTMSLIIGAIIGAFLAKPVGNMLLASEIESTQSTQEEMSNNFGKPGGMDMQLKEKVEVEKQQEIWIKIPKMKF